MIYLVFETREDAENANDKISNSMGLSGNFTEKWDDVISTEDGKFSVVKPEPRFMSEVSGYIEK